MSLTGPIHEFSRGWGIQGGQFALEALKKIVYWGKIREFPERVSITGGVPKTRMTHFRVP